MSEERLPGSESSRQIEHDKRLASAPLAAKQAMAAPRDEMLHRPRLQRSGISIAVRIKGRQFWILPRRFIVEIILLKTIVKFRIILRLRRRLFRFLLLQNLRPRRFRSPAIDPAVVVGQRQFRLGVLASASGDLVVQPILPQLAAADAVWELLEMF
jgi:hypothetical protein